MLSQSRMHLKLNHGKAHTLEPAQAEACRVKEHGHQVELFSQWQIF
jgi:hypothetical protein